METHLFIAFVDSVNIKNFEWEYPKTEMYVLIVDGA